MNTISNIKAFKTHDEAEAYRQKLKHKDQYTLYCAWHSDDLELWTVIPLTAAQAMMDWREE